MSQWQRRGGDDCKRCRGGQQNPTNRRGMGSNRARIGAQLSGRSALGFDGPLLLAWATGSRPLIEDDAGEEGAQLYDDSVNCNIFSNARKMGQVAGPRRRSSRCMGAHELWQFCISRYRLSPSWYPAVDIGGFNKYDQRGGDGPGSPTFQSDRTLYGSMRHGKWLHSLPSYYGLLTINEPSHS